MPKNQIDVVKAYLEARISADFQLVSPQMCAKTNVNEKRILTLSALISSGFAMGGLVVGLLVSSLVILFDGMYSLVSLLLTILSLIAARRTVN